MMNTYIDNDTVDSLPRHRYSKKAGLKHNEVLCFNASCNRTPKNTKYRDTAFGRRGKPLPKQYCSVCEYFYGEQRPASKGYENNKRLQNLWCRGPILLPKLGYNGSIGCSETYGNKEWVNIEINRIVSIENEELAVLEADGFSRQFTNEHIVQKQGNMSKTISFCSCCQNLNTALGKHNRKNAKKSLDISLASYYYENEEILKELEI